MAAEKRIEKKETLIFQKTKHDITSKKLPKWMSNPTLQKATIGAKIVTLKIEILKD